MGFLAILVIIGVFWLVVVVLGLIHKGFLSLVSGYVTPESHRRIGEYEESEGHELLRNDGFSVTADWASNAMSKVERN